MKVLVVIPHYYKAKPNGMYGSSSQNEAERIRVIERVITSWRDIFATPTASVHQQVKEEGAHKEVSMLLKAADRKLHLKPHLIFVTTPHEHLLDKINVPIDSFSWQKVNISDPLYLGFACHQVLKSLRGHYDYYCYTEDDLIVHDPFFFRKLRWFEITFGSKCLLQPHRYMTKQQPINKEYKEYIDFEYKRYTEYWIDYTKQPLLTADYLGEPLNFFKTRNPHAGCFFLSATQYEMMCSRPNYALPNSQFAGPLESAASFDIMQTFNIYRPEFSQGAFLTIEHIGKRPLGGIPRIVEPTGFLTNA